MALQSGLQAACRANAACQAHRAAAVSLARTGSSAYATAARPALAKREDTHAGRASEVRARIQQQSSCTGARLHARLFNAPVLSLFRACGIISQGELYWLSFSQEIASSVEAECEYVASPGSFDVCWLGPSLRPSPCRARARAWEGGCACVQRRCFSSATPMMQLSLGVCSVCASR